MTTTFGTELQLSSLDGISGFQINGEAAGDFLGFCVASAGDINGDGFDDVIVGAYQAGPNGFDSGASYIVFGSAGGFGPSLDLSSLNGSNGFQISGAAVFNQSGISVASAGDVNGDGFDDVIVGAETADGFGASYVVFGHAGSFESGLDLSTPGALDGSNGFKISGEQLGGRSGRSVASAGDLNGDGFDDMIIGDDFADSATGAAYVVFGRAGGFDPNLNLSTLNGANGFKISGEAAGDIAGIAVASAGDINGDGFDDVIVGAYFADANGADAGASYVIFGKPGGFNPNFNLLGLAATDGFKISGEAAGDLLGGAVNSAGDVNGDGFDDLIVGAYDADANGADSGASYVVFGKAGGFGTSFALSSLNGVNGFKISGEAAGDQSGVSVASAGDINGDGFDDVIVGAFTADANGTDSGASYLVFGRAGGFAAELDLSALDSAYGFKITGEALGDLSGRSVAAAGDVNGDGFDDMIIGSYTADPNGNDSGAAYVVYGKATRGTAGNDILDCSGADDTLAGLDGNDIMRGHGGADILAGGAGNDLLDGGAGLDQLFAGAGNDTYVLGTEAAGLDTVTDAAGIDTITSTISRSLGFADYSEIENLTLLGTAASGTGNLLANTITGNAAANVLDGGSGNDALKGLAGNDILIGNLGLDTLTGGAGNDIFRFATASHSGGANIDRITDFDDSGNDRIDLSKVFAGTLHYIHDAAFNAAGQVRINDIPGADVIVEVNTGGSLAADMQIRLTDTTLVSMSASDFIL